MKPLLSVFWKSARSTVALWVALLACGGCGDDVTVLRDMAKREAAPVGGAGAANLIS